MIEEEFYQRVGTDPVSRQVCRECGDILDDQGKGFCGLCNRYVRSCDCDEPAITCNVDFCDKT